MMMQWNKTKSSFLLVLVALIIPSAAFGLTLDEAKQKGWVGEQPDGYLGIVEPSAGAEVRALAVDVNMKRKDRYLKIARETGADLAAVEALAGKKAIEKSAPGHFILLPSARWVKKE
jgi:uncharacterized protein YdbL (DUF1318 family)